MGWAIRGVIEGFYGTPWSWDSRVEVSRYCADRGMTHYVYAPKDDPKHRERWQEPYDEGELDGFRSLVGEGRLQVGFGISPGLSMDYRSDDDRATLLAKVDQVLGTGVSLVCLALDDIPNRPGLGTEHGEVTRWLHDRLTGRAQVILVPTEYVGTAATAYLDEVAALVPDDVPIAWTGTSVVNDRITAAEASGRAAALGGRAPLLWDNVPVNDGIMADRLFMGPLWGREPGLADVCGGYLANPMVQPRSSLLPLCSTAAWLRGDDPLEAWAVEAEAWGLRVFAEACDGAVPRMLVQGVVDEVAAPGWADAATPLAHWLREASRCAAPGLEHEAGEWIEQVHREARVALEALTLLQATKPVVRIGADGAGRVAPPSDEDVLLRAFSLASRWPGLWRSPASVMGVRLGFRPELGQRDDGAWQLRPGMVQLDQNAVDALARAALARATDLPRPEPVTVEVDGRPVDVGDDGGFRAPPGATVVARSGGAATRVRAPAEPPVPDARLGA